MMKAFGRTGRAPVNVGLVLALGALLCACAEESTQNGPWTTSLGGSGGIAGGPVGGQGGASVGATGGGGVGGGVAGDGGTPAGGQGGVAEGGAAAGGGTAGDGGSGATSSGGAAGTGGAAGGAPGCVPLDDAVTAEGMLVHLEALEQIALDHGGHRAAGSPGWDASAAYVAGELTGMGYTVEVGPVQHPYYEMLGLPTLARTVPDAHDYLVSADGSDPSADFQHVNASPPGNVTAAVEAVDLAFGPGNASTSGCDSADFDSFTPGSIALIQRGTCPFQAKMLNAQDAGASGVVLFNQGNTSTREGLMPGGVTILGDGPDHGVSIPVVFATYAVGTELDGLLASGAVTLHLTVDSIWEVRTTNNLIVETTGGSADDVVILGAHLDSVPQGPGINDNATGVAALLEIARAAAPCEVTRKLRFAWWAAEEFGQWGSATYVFGPSAPDPSTIHSYLNIDVVGSTNPVHFVYDGDGSEFGAAGPPGSGEIEAFFAADLLLQGLPHDEVFTDQSDHFPFFLIGVPYGGLFSGVGDPMTPLQAALFGGTAGAPYDPCYHASCDTVDNVSLAELESLSKSLARAAQYFGVDGLSVPPSEGALPSCKELKQAFPDAADGLYLIDPDGAGGLPPFQEYCDMTTDGGGWTRCYTAPSGSIGIQTWMLPDSTCFGAFDGDSEMLFRGSDDSATYLKVVSGRHDSYGNWCKNSDGVSPLPLPAPPEAVGLGPQPASTNYWNTAGYCYIGGNNDVPGNYFYGWNHGCGGSLTIAAGATGGTGCEHGGWVLGDLWVFRR